jgi:hypothetical protein
MTRKRVRTERLQIPLSRGEQAAIEDFQFRNQLPTKAAAVRELMRRALASSENDLECLD